MSTKANKKFSKMLKKVAQCLWPILSIVISLLINVLVCALCFDNTPDTVAKAIQSSGSPYVLHELYPVDKDVNLTSVYRRAITNSKYQTNLTGSSVVYYSVQDSDTFKPFTITVNDNKYGSSVIGCYDHFNQYDYGFKTVDGKDVVTFETSNADDIFLTQCFADEILEKENLTDYNDLIGHKFNSVVLYKDDVAHAFSTTVIGVISDESLKNIGLFEGNRFIYCQFPDIIQYRLTYAHLHSLLRSNEKTANRFFVNNFHILSKQSGGLLGVHIYESINKNTSLGKIDSLYQKCYRHTSNTLNVIGAVLLVANAAISLAVVFLVCKKGKYFHSTYYYNLYLSLLLSSLLLFLLSLIPPFAIGNIVLYFATPMSIFTSFVVVAIYLIEFRFMGEKLSRETHFVNSEYTEINI